MDIHYPICIQIQLKGKQNSYKGNNYPRISDHTWLTGLVWVASHSHRAAAARAMILNSAGCQRTSGIFSCTGIDACSVSASLSGCTFIICGTSNLNWQTLDENKVWYQWLFISKNIWLTDWVTSLISLSCETLLTNANHCSQRKVVIHYAICICSTRLNPQARVLTQSIETGLFAWAFSIWLATTGLRNGLWNWNRLR